MRRLRIAAMLPLLALLLLAQQGAMLHELSHLRVGGSVHAAQLRAVPALVDAGPCLLCEAFAQIAHPAASSLAAPPIEPPASPPDPAVVHSEIGTDAPTPHSRGPPSHA